ncbi:MULTISPECIES: GGDEF domain-containing protein [unclassified Butyrivibrio]|uniref:GGDEF domain-containing protein n=1 Tax=unclassified Butyrivibrio TaxID=2639466 RepID=UPI0003FD9FC6|nr:MULTISPECIES: GGDEF domain-containing protein [unclassified Butyrivibrio]
MRRKILFLTISFISFLLLTLIGHFWMSPSGIEKVSVLSDGWDVRYNDVEFTDVSLPALRRLIGSATQKGDHIVLENKVEGLGIYTAPTLLFESRFSAWRVTCNGKLVGEHNFDLYEINEFIGCEDTFLNLPSCGGAEASVIIIEYLVSEDSAYNFYESPVIGEYMDVLLYAVYSNMFVFMTSAFLMIFGLMFFAISIGFRSDLPEMDMQIYSSLLYIMLGVWFLTQFRLMDIFLDTGGHQTEIEYISLYLLVPLMYMVMGCMQDYLKDKVFLFFSVSGTVISLSLIAIHFMGLVHINRMLMVYQINALAMCVLMIVYLVRDSINHRITNSQIIQLAGETVLALSFFFNVFFYYLEVAGISEQIMLSKKAVPLGAICMVFATLVNYRIYISDSYASKVEHQSLARLAYEDDLTGIPNRSRYEKYLTDLGKTDEDYCVVSIDLNGLKSVNDTKGHLVGDKYLSEFTEAFTGCFGKSGFIARIGGDEFVSILRGDDLDMADELIQRLDGALLEMNKKDPSMERSAAAGFAYRHETNGSDWNSVYLLADERMYKKKSGMKHSR